MVKEIVEDKKISIALLSSSILIMVQYFIILVMNNYGFNNTEFIYFFPKVILGLVFLYCFKIVWKRSSFFIIVLYTGASFIFALNYLYFFANREVLNEMFFTVFFISLPTLIFAFSLKNFQVFYVYMKKTANIIFYLGVAITGFMFISMDESFYSISLSYLMLFPTIIFINELIRKFNTKIFIKVIMSIVVILTLGSRGALISITFFLIMKIIKANKKSSLKNFYMRFLTIGVLILTILNIKNILLQLSLVLQEFGMDSRTIRLLLEDEVHLSGRDSLVTKVLESVFFNPITGIGIGGDRVVNGGNYSHNVFVELVASFGVILGGISSILLIALLFNTLLTKVSVEYDIALIWISIGFIPLLVSSSFFTESKFWLLIGLLLIIGKKSNPQKKDIYE